MKLYQKDAVIVTVRQVCDIWSKARIPTAEERNIVRKLQLLLGKHRRICRNTNRGGEVQMAREKNFDVDLNQLFDMAHDDAM